MQDATARLKGHLPDVKAGPTRYRYVGIPPDILTKLDALCDEYKIPGRSTLVQGLIKSHFAEVFPAAS